MDERRRVYISMNDGTTYDFDERFSSSFTSILNDKDKQFVIFSEVVDGKRVEYHINKNNISTIEIR
ncbi:hypothetical protein [Macrococcoides canis]|uniref:hypothetical protein n=1 Tax=Macrococcoides canis TaxID=1855823 RepID=UPI0020B88941|nr:hypothetical protein [Macrococcus canis]UTH07951.1 hypothetical protein KFV07_05935 [Macrococcus canis]